VRWWKVLGLAGFAGVAATGVVIARDERQRRAYTPPEIRERLHARLAEAADVARPAPAEGARPTPAEDARPTPAKDAGPTPAEDARPTPAEGARPAPGTAPQDDPSRDEGLRA
jgi:hypothetical protein